MSYIVVETTKYHEVRLYNDHEDIKKDANPRVTRGDLKIVLDFNYLFPALEAYVEIYTDPKWIRYHEQPSWYKVPTVPVQIRVFLGDVRASSLFYYSPVTDYYFINSKIAYLSNIRTEQLNNKQS